MTDHVDRTLSMWRATAFKWGERDCLLSVADYVVARTGRDPAKGYRGTYSDEAGAMAHIDARGGVVALVDASGLDRTDEPARGDIVVVDVGGESVAGLYTGEGVAMRVERGVVEINKRFVRILGAWSWP